MRVSSQKKEEMQENIRAFQSCQGFLNVKKFQLKKLIISLSKKQVLRALFDYMNLVKNCFLDVDKKKQKRQSSRSKQHLQSEPQQAALNSHHLIY